MVVDNYFTGSKDNLKQWFGHPRFELIRHGKLSLNSLISGISFCWMLLGYLSLPYLYIFRVADVTEPLLIEVDQIYHLACPASPIFYKHNPVKVSFFQSRPNSYYWMNNDFSSLLNRVLKQTIKTNVIGTLNMLGLAKRVGARFEILILLMLWLPNIFNT